MANVLGTYSKAVKSARTINFSRSGLANCSTKCRHNPNYSGPEHLKTGGCYAVVVEKRADRAQLAAKLERHHQMGDAQVVGKAILELQALIGKGKAPKWVRFSSNGSLPMPEKASPLFVGQLRVFLQLCKDNSIPVHLPLEDGEKTEFYRSKVGDLVTIRESLQDPSETTTKGGAVSFVVGDDIREGGSLRARRASAAREAARARFIATGRKTIVCPAVTSGWDKRAGKRPDKILCGQCTACANGNIDIVYPFH